MSNPPNPKQRYGDMKAAIHQIPPAALIGMAKALSEGAVKYGPFNWRKTDVESMTYVGAMYRHLLAYLDGEFVDPESKTGKSHLDGIMACAAILTDCHEGGWLIDNRPPEGPAPKLLRTPGAFIGAVQEEMEASVPAKDPTHYGVNY